MDAYIGQWHRGCGLILGTPIRSGNGTGTETDLCGDGWGWDRSSAGMGGDGSETAWGRVGMFFFLLFKHFLS